MGRTGRLRKPELRGSHKDLNRALHELHKGAGLPSLATVATELKGAGISRSTIYDAFASTRLPNWHVVDALVEVLAERHPATAPEQEVQAFHALWLLAVDEEDDQDERHEPDGPQEVTGDQLAVRSALRDVQLWSAAASGAGPTAGGLIETMGAEAWQRIGERITAIFGRRYKGRIWLKVPFEQKERVKELGGRWDRDYMLWFIEAPVPELMPYEVPGPHPPQLGMGDTQAG